MDEKLNKIFDHSECPPGEVLRKYVQGELSGKELRSFEEHLASCEMCSDEVEGMAFINNPEKIEADVTFLKQQIDSKLATDAAPKTIPMYLKIAAAVLFLFAVSFIVYVIINNNSLSEKSLLSVNTNSDRIIHKEALSEEKKPVAQEEESLAKEGEKLSQLQENKCKDKKPKATIIDAVTEDSEKESLSDADNNFDKKMSKQDTDNRRENLGYGVSAGSGKAAVTKSEEKIFSTADASPIMKTEASKPDKDEASKKQTMAQKDKPVTNEQINSDGVLLAEEKSALESESTISNETKSRKESGEKSRNEPDEKKKEKKVSREKSTYNNEEQKRASGESYAKKKADNKNAEMPASASTISQDATTGSTSFIEEAMVAYNDKKYSLAADLFENIIKDNPSNMKAVYYCACSYYYAEKLNKSKKHFELLVNMGVSEYTEDAEYYIALIYTKKKETEKAKKLLQQIISKNGKRKAEAEKKLGEID